MMIKSCSRFFLFYICFVLAACDTKVPLPEPHAPLPVDGAMSKKISIQNTNLALFLNSAEASYKKLANFGDSLQASISNFILSPNPENLKKAKEVLLQTHHQYMLSQVFQKIDILHPEFDLLQSQDPVIHPLHIRLDQFPLIKGYLDAVPNYPFSGLVFSEHKLSIDYLNNEHQFSDKAYVAIGFHALELMLTGAINQTLEERSLEFTKITNTSDTSTPSYRRSVYIQLLTELINNDLKKLLIAWAGNNGFYAKALNELAPDESERLIQQAYKIEEHALSKIKEHVNDAHSDAIKERKAQLALIQNKQTL